MDPFGPLKDAGNGIVNAGDAVIHPNRTLGKVSDSAVADKKTHLSEIIGTAFSGADKPIAMALAMAESNGRTSAVNHLSCGRNKDGSTAHAIGLMQVCTVNAGVAGSPADPDEFTKWLKDPYNNAKAGAAIKESQGWGAWETYTSGAYRSKMGQDPLITVDKNSLTDNNIVNGVTDTVNAAGDVASFVGKLVSALFDPSTYFRIGKGLLGANLLIIGTIALAFIAANKASGGKVAETTKKAATTAAAAAAVA